MTTPSIVVMLKGFEDSLYFHYRGATMWQWTTHDDVPRLQIIDEDEGTLAEFPAEAVIAVYNSLLECACPCVDERGIQVGHPAEVPA